MDKKRLKQQYKCPLLKPLASISWDAREDGWEVNLLAYCKGRDWIYLQNSTFQVEINMTDGRYRIYERLDRSLVEAESNEEIHSIIAKLLYIK